ncbi:MAG TPA: GNAT family N-acetyltransferase [Mycobacteriales bacterium]|nr:GNAT family N-acetyltransferase [Mycobacteriales bacterium]
MTAVEVHPATSAADVEAVLRLRYETYVAELRLFTDVADHEHRRLGDEHDQTAHLLLATVDGEPGGTIRLVVGASVRHPEFEENYDISRWCPDPVSPEEVMVCSKFAVLPAHRRGLVPWELIRATVEFGLSHGVELVFCDCQPHLVSLYESLGFRSYRSTYRDPHIAATVPLVLLANDVDHLEQIGSPLLDLGIRGRRRTRSTMRALAVLGDSSAGTCAEAATPERLRRLAAFDGLTDDELQTVISRGQILRLGSGDRLIQTGHATHTMYVVLGGVFRVVDEGGTVAQFSTGDLIGEIAFLLRGQRTADVYAASEDAQALALSDTTLTHLIAEHGPAAAKLLHNLARTLAGRLAVRSRGGRFDDPVAPAPAQVPASGGRVTPV